MDFIPQWLFYIGAAVLGLELGSIASIFIHRWIDELPILKPAKSRCPSCGAKLTWRDTVPVLSYVFLKGRCRHCEEPIGGQYMLVEISCMAWALALAYHYGLSVEWGVYLILGTMLITGSFIDFETGLLPDRITIGGTVLAFGASFILPDGPYWQDAILGALLGGGFLWILHYGYQLWRKDTGLGLGDVKLMCMIGALTGVDGVVFTVIAGGLAGYIGVGITLLRRAKGEDKLFPYGPFLSFGCMLYILYGGPISRWWASF